LIISELFKERLNTSTTDNLYFWRDKTGHEIDVLTDEAAILNTYEIKSGETISNDFFKGLDYFSKVNAAVQHKTLIYGGKQQQERSDGIVVQTWDKFFET